MLSSVQRLNIYIDQWLIYGLIGVCYWSTPLINVLRFRIDFGVAEFPPEVGPGDMRCSVESDDVTDWVCHSVLASGHHKSPPRGLVSELLQYAITFTCARLSAWERVCVCACVRANLDYAGVVRGQHVYVLLTTAWENIRLWNVCPVKYKCTVLLVGGFTPNPGRGHDLPQENSESCIR